MTANEHPAELRLELRRILAAPPERVFRCWTDPAELKRWFAPNAEFQVPSAEVDLRVGGQYRIVMQAPDGQQHAVLGVYREVVPGERLVFTWAWEGGFLGVEETLVTVEFRPHGSGTELVLSHTRFPSVEARDMHQQGWNDCLARLPAIL